MPVMVLCKNAQTRVNVCSILELQDVIAFANQIHFFIGHLIKAFRCKFYYSIKSWCIQVMIVKPFLHTKIFRITVRLFSSSYMSYSF